MTILCYHSIEPGWAHPLAVQPDAFAAQCSFVSGRRDVLGLREALPRLDRRGRLPSGMVALTFDDGFEALYEHALPVLRRHHLPATVFLVARTLLPDAPPVDWVDNAGDGDLRTLSLDQVLEMRDAGVDFQSHSYAHHSLTELGFDECVKDLRESRELIEDLIHRPVDLLAYPRGLHDEKVRKATARAGYRYAFALPVGPERPEPYAVPRVGIYRGNGMSTMRIKCCRPYLDLRMQPGINRSQRQMRNAIRRLRLR